MHFFKMLFLPHLLVLLLAFEFLSATSPTPDVANVHTVNARGRPRLPTSPLTRSNTQYAERRSLIARDLYELPNGWVRTVFLSI